ncbi:MAG: glycine cleavage system protein GcvH [Proteobacteria bacterium]|nr:glycine cleavage system protein GcvH [Pseudomonadota bacterium]MBU4573728.1 glycine cleavage system protein GcvH [Pseudomonadota bacterium]MBU4598498.1 glycine cleavage system protein GcvH [Pseudomonadota bacterium]
MQFPGGLRYSKEHTWVVPSGNTVKVGITDFAQDQLGEVIFVELPGEGDEFDQDAEFGVVESAKSTSDLFMPISGEVVVVNHTLEDEPGLVNQSPYQDGWMLEIKPRDPSQLEAIFSAEEYLGLIKKEA